MAKVMRHSGPGANRGYGQRVMTHGEWQEVPWRIFWRRWMGHTLRRRNANITNGVGWWEYANGRKLAARKLEQEFDPDIYRDVAQAMQAPTQQDYLGNDGHGNL